MSRCGLHGACKKLSHRARDRSTTSATYMRKRLGRARVNAGRGRMFTTVLHPFELSLDMVRKSNRVAKACHGCSRKDARALPPAARRSRTIVVCAAVLSLGTLCGSLRFVGRGTHGRNPIVTRNAAAPACALVSDPGRQFRYPRRRSFIHVRASGSGPADYNGWSLTRWNGGLR